DRQAGGEPAPREECREQPRLGGLAGVKRLCHRAERRLEARRLRPGQAEGVEPLLLVEAEEMRTGGRGAEGPEGGRRVEARGVVPGPEERAQAALELDAGNERAEEAGAPGALALDEGERP